MRLLSQTHVQLGSTSVQLVGANTRRYALVISSDSAAAFTLSFKGPAVLGQGIQVAAGSPPLQLSYDSYGDALREPIYAIAATGTPTIGVLDFFGP